MKKQDINKRAEQIADAIGELPEQMISDALHFEEIKGKQKRKRRHRIEVLSGLAAAAIVCIVVLYGSDRSFLQKQTADVDRTAEKAALKESDQKKDVLEEKLDIWCMASGMGEDAAAYEYSDSQDQSSGNADVKKGSGESGQKESQEKQKNGDTEQNGELLQAGKRQLLHTNITGGGEDERVQFTLQAGRMDDSMGYTLKASGVSMELIAENYKAQNKIILQGNKKSKITCASGTQIGCSLSVVDMTDGTGSPSITVVKENKDTGEKVRGEIRVEQEKGKYYLYLTEK